MSKIARFVGNLVAFASGALGGERTVFGDVAQSDVLTSNINADFIRGWANGVDLNGFPPRQYFNAIGFTATQIAAYLHQMGVAEWDSLQEYHIDSIANVGGVLYTSLTNTNVGNDPTSDITNWVVASRTAKIQPVNASVAANALTLTLNATELDFRDNALTSGTVNSRPVIAPISLVISSGSTLGTISTKQSRIAILAIDNGGTIELAAVNLAGGNNLDETTLITTVAEGGAGAADSANVIYSTTARTNVPFRVVGYAESTQATAGTWVTAPSTIQGYGGQAFAAMSSIGYSQTLQDVTGSRALSTTYYNTTGKPIQVFVLLSFTAIGTPSITVNGILISGHFQGSIATGVVPAVIVPPGGSYSVTSSGTSTLSAWIELR